jgi:hypothetical protein
MRDLVGWYDSGSQNDYMNASSRDLRHPGVVLVGSHLRLGDTDHQAASHNLTITAVAPEGFWGWWRVELGLRVNHEFAGRRVMPDPAGYFCAYRVERESKPDR